jgi:ABC-2 type transport system permease protein
LVKKELRRYWGSPFGLMWSTSSQRPVRHVLLGDRFADPAQDRGPQVHIFCGMIMVAFFTDAMTSGSKSIVKNKSLVRKINLPRGVPGRVADGVGLHDPDM